jgi:hypothetical protein
MTVAAAADPVVVVVVNGVKKGLGKRLGGGGINTTRPRLAQRAAWQ